MQDKYDDQLAVLTPGYFSRIWVEKKKICAEVLQPTLKQDLVILLESKIQRVPFWTDELCISELPYGDQAIFLRKKVYLQVGGMPGYPLFEDFALVSNSRLVFCVYCRHLKGKNNAIKID
jgi:hypothetical protein